MVYRNGTRAKLGALLLLVCGSGSGCLKPDEFPKEPRLSYKSFAQQGDSASFTISFTDGDGDVGLDASDSEPPFDTASPYYHNLFLELDTLHFGAWGRVQFLVPLYYRIPRITPTGQNKALEGEVSVALRPWPFLNPGSTPDTVRISAYMLDRSLNQSNTVTSETFVVTQ